MRIIWYTYPLDAHDRSDDDDDDDDIKLGTLTDLF